MSFTINKIVRDLHKTPNVDWAQNKSHIQKSTNVIVIKIRAKTYCGL